MLLLAKGSPLYSGPSAKCLAYFEHVGYILPPFVNPAEYLIDLAAIDTRSPDAEESSGTRVQSLIQAFRTSSEYNGLQAAQEKSSLSPIESADTHSGQHHATLSQQVRVLTGRSFKTTYRDPMGIAGSMLEATSMAVITGWIFLQLDGSLSGIRSREGALYTAAALRKIIVFLHIFSSHIRDRFLRRDSSFKLKPVLHAVSSSPLFAIGMLTLCFLEGYLILLYECYRLTVDIQLFDREHREGVVSVSSFLISRRLARVWVEDVPVPLVFSVIFYFMVGFRPLASQFFVFFGVTLLSQYIAINLATLCVAVSRSFAGASFIANMGYTLQSLGCGYFVQANQIPIWVRWLKVCRKCRTWF